MSSARLRRVAVSPVAALLVSLPLAAGTGAQAVRGASLSAAACQLVGGTLVFVETAPGTAAPKPIGNGCILGECWQRVSDPNNPEQQICHYARAALITLGRKATAKQARAVVLRQIRRGLRRVNVGADVAGIGPISRPMETGTVVEMAVGRTVALFTLGASSDDDPSPAFPNVEQLAVRYSKQSIVFYLRRGCPAKVARC
jgi:hypothetical protein